jgi:hypothetical protein
LHLAPGRVFPHEIFGYLDLFFVFLYFFFTTAYFILPLVLLNWPESANNHYVKTLRDAESRQGSYIEFDRARYKPLNVGNVLITFAEEEILVKGLKLKYPATVSVRGYFLDNNSVHTTEFHIHSDWFRDVASYTGLTLIAVMWIVSIIIRGKLE